MEGSIKIVMAIVLLHLANANKPVTLELYYESLCFACQNFISGPLQEAYETLQGSGKVKLSSVKTKVIDLASKSL